MRKLSKIAIVLLTALATAIALGCSGGGSSNPPPSSSSTPPPVPEVISPGWSIQAMSQKQSGSVLLLEADITQAGSDFFTGDQTTLVLSGETQSNGFILITGFGGQCDSGLPFHDSIEGQFTATNLPPSVGLLNIANFSFTEETGPLTATGTLTFNQAGTSIVGGSYSTPAGCGAQADSGTVTGRSAPIFVFGNPGSPGSLEDSVLADFGEASADIFPTSLQFPGEQVFSITSLSSGLTHQWQGPQIGNAAVLQPVTGEVGPPLIVLYDPNNVDLLVWEEQSNGTPPKFEGIFLTTGSPLSLANCALAFSPSCALYAQGQ